MNYWKVKVKEGSLKKAYYVESDDRTADALEAVLKEVNPSWDIKSIKKVDKIPFETRKKLEENEEKSK